MRRLLPLSAVVLLLAACGGDDGPTDEQQVRETLRTFATAVETRDYQTLCDEVFAPKLLEGLQQIGLPCEIAMRTSLGEVEEPRLTVGEVTVDGTRATAEVRTSAKGQPPSTDTLELAEIEDRWRVTDLDSGGQEGGGATGPSGPTGAASATPTRTPRATPEPSRTAEPSPSPSPSPTASP